MRKTTFLLLLLLLPLTIQAQRLSIKEKVDSVLSLMTLQEKIGQLNQYTGDHALTGPLNNQSDKREAIIKGEVGSVLNIHGVANVRKVQEYATQSRLGIPLLFALDVIHGYKTTFPIPLAEAASWDLDAIEKSARIAAVEAAAAGVNWTFAPMLDIARDPRWGRVMEGAGEDVFLASKISERRVKGFQGKALGDTNSIFACAKHFVGYGAAEGGRDYNTTDISERRLFETYFPPFEAAVKANVGSFMTSFNDINGFPSTGNKWLYRDILRDKWNYSGIVVSDWGAIGELIAHGFAEDLSEASKKAIIAGVDIDMESSAYIKHLNDLISDKKIDVSLIDEAVKRILYKKFELGLFDDPFKYIDTNREERELNNPSHRQFAKEIAEKSIVMLKRDDSVLPLKENLKTIAVIGPLTKSREDMKGNWSVPCDNYDDYISPFDGLLKRVPSTTKMLYAKGCEVEGSDKSGFKEAIRVAKKADVVLMFMGESWHMSGEAKSRTDISLPGVQEELIKEIHKTGKPIVLLLSAGRPLTFPWCAENVGSIIYTWFLGIEAGNAIASVLYGDYNPSGKLPMSFPRSVGQIPIYYDHKNSGRPLLDENKIEYVSAYIDSKNTPQYPFGHGLSYTTFAFSNLQTDKREIKKGETITISCDIKNNGKYGGEEVVQLYIRDRYASVTRPVKELKGFKKIFLKPGESTKIIFPISSEELAFYNESMVKNAEGGVFDIFIGSSSEKIELVGNFFLNI